MRVIFHNLALDIAYVTSEKGILAIAESEQENAIVLAEPDSPKNALWRASFSTDSVEKSHLSILVYPSIRGTIPELYIMSTNKPVAIGFDASLVGIDVHERKILFQHNIEYPFRSFFVCNELGIVLVFHEVGVIAFDTKWNRLWTFAGDIIRRINVTGDSVELSFLDEESEILSLTDGHRTKP